MTKKLFFLCIVGLFFSVSVYAACNGGTIVTAKSGTFCKSNVDMNWWSAAAWCKANGMKLATMYEMCPTWDGTDGDNKCSELSGSFSDCWHFAWSATASGSENAYSVKLCDGDVNAHHNRKTPSDYDGYFAFCN